MRVCDSRHLASASKWLCYIPIMLVDSYIVPECIVRPRTLGGLISLYEANFIKLTWLLADQWRDTGTFVSCSSRDCDLYLTVEEHSRFTRQLRLTYMFQEPSGAVADPDMLLRTYLDARVAEVVAWADHQRHPLLCSLVLSYGGEIDRRWARNMVLGKWLDFLLDNGHSFALCRAR